MRLAHLTGIAILSVAAFSCASRNEVTGASGSAVTLSDAAIVDDLAARFQIHYERPARVEDGDVATDEVPPPPQKLSTSVLPASIANGNRAAPNGRQIPSFPADAKTTLAQEHAAFADDVTELAASGAAIRVRRIGTSHVKASFANGNYVYRSAAVGNHVIVHPTSEGFEDFVVFEKAPSTSETIYELSLVGEAKYLRLVSGVLEVLSDSGNPVFRASPPFLVDTKGKVTHAALSVGGCLVSTDPAAPWGSKLVAPGASVCRVTVSWDGSAVAYPAVLDPAWTSTGSMIEGRGDFTATMLDTGYVLVAGGHGSAPTVGAELYNPTTGTFASTGAPVTRRDDHIAVKLPNGKVLIAGGEQTGVWTTIRTAELYNPATGTFAATATMRSARRDFAAQPLANGKVMVFGGWNGGAGYYATTEIYDPAVPSWTTTVAPTMSASRSGLRATTLTNGKILVTGGYNGSAILASTEIYDPTANTFSTGPSMSVGRRLHAQASAGFAGDAIVSGGMTSATTTTTSVELYNGPTNSFLPAGTMSQERMKHVAIPLDQSTYLFAGGQDHTTACQSGTDRATTFSPSTAPSTSMANARSNFAAVQLAVGKVLVMGGYDGAVYRTQAEIYAPTPDLTSYPSESASLMPALVSWDSPTATGAFAVASTLTGTVENNSPTPRNVRIDLVANGLDNRLVSRAVTTVNIAPYSTSAVSVALSDVPVQSVGSETTFWLRAQALLPAGGPDGPATDGAHQSAEWNATYTTATLHGELGMDLDRTQPAAQTTVSGWIAATHSTFHALATRSGRVWNGATFDDVNTLPSVGANGVTYAARGQWSTDIQNLAPSFVTNYTPTGPSAWYRICVNWRTIFTDNQTSNGLSDDYVTGTENPAALAWTTILTDEPTPQVPFTGFLDASGCTDAIRLGTTEKFTVLTMTLVQKPASGGTGAIITYYKEHHVPPQGGLGPLLVAEALTLPPGSGGSDYTAPDFQSITPSVEDKATRAAAVVGRIIGLDTMLPSGFVANVFANLGCVGQPWAWDNTNSNWTEACGNNGELFIGYVLDTVKKVTNFKQHNSQYKYVIAHEFGHVINGATFGLLHFDTNAGQLGVSQAACRCDHLGSGNNTHCLTSRQDQSFAMNEAFGHFVASRAFNSTAQSDCSFAYYKSSYNGSDPGLPPPQNVNCLATPKWMETNCSAGEDYGGVELDWFTFYYAVTRGTNALTLPYLDESFRRACTGSPTSPCGGHFLYFNRMPLAGFSPAPSTSLAAGYCNALFAHGAPGATATSCFLSSEHTRFMTEGNLHGIDH